MKLLKITNQMHINTHLTYEWRLIMNWGSTVIIVVLGFDGEASYLLCGGAAEAAKTSPQRPQRLV